MMRRQGICSTPISSQEVMLNVPISTKTYAEYPLISTKTYLHVTHTWRDSIARVKQSVVPLPRGPLQ